MLTTIDRYVLRQVAKPLATAMAIGLLMLFSERLVRLLDTTLGKKNSFSVAFELLAYVFSAPLLGNRDSGGTFPGPDVRFGRFEGTAKSTLCWRSARACTD